MIDPAFESRGLIAQPLRKVAASEVPGAGLK
jgi:hypothetical protein